MVVTTTEASQHPAARDTKYNNHLSVRPSILCEISQQENVLNELAKSSFRVQPAGTEIIYIKIHLKIFGAFLDKNSP